MGRRGRTRHTASCNRGVKGGAGGFRTGAGDARISTTRSRSSLLLKAAKLIADGTSEADRNALVQRILRYYHDVGEFERTVEAPDSLLEKAEWNLGPAASSLS